MGVLLWGSRKWSKINRTSSLNALCSVFDTITVPTIFPSSEIYLTTFSDSASYKVRIDNIDGRSVDRNKILYLVLHTL